MYAPSLRTLLNVDDPTELLAKHWPEERLVAYGPVERLAGLVDYDVDALIAMKKTFTRAFFRSPSGEAISMAVTEGQERSLYDAGFTLYFHSLKHPEIDRWVSALDGELGLVRGATRVTGFASRRGLGLPMHFDHNDNFVCQAQGKKRWRVARNEHVRHPTVGYCIGDKPSPHQRAEAPRGLPTEVPSTFETVELTPGTVMFMPRGMWHDTETVEEASLHFNVQCGLATWKDVLEFVLLGTTALHEESLRAPVRELLSDEPDVRLEAQWREKLRDLCEAISAGDFRIDRDALYRFVAKRRSA